MFRFYTKPGETKNRVSIVGEHSEGMLKIAVARCSEKDQFFKKKGRAIAEKRLSENKLFKSFSMNNCDLKTFVYIAKAVAAEVEKTKVIY